MKKLKNSGFTLVEMMIAVALVGLVIGISTSGWVALSRASAITKQCSQMHAQLRNAFDIMSKDVTGSSSIPDGNDRWFRLAAMRQGVATTVFYVFADGKFWQVDDKVTALVDDVTGFDYTMYLDDGLTETLVHTEAYSIDITVTTERTVGNEAFDDAFQGRIMLRNKL